MYCICSWVRESAEPAGADHTGDIVSFTAVGSGAEGTSPRPWVCYTTPPTLQVNGGGHTNVEWQTPDGAAIANGSSPANDIIVQRSVGGIIPGVILYRGTNYFSPDGDYCCVLTMNGTESERRCVTFSEYWLYSVCPTLITPHSSLSHTGYSHLP